MLKKYDIENGRVCETERDSAQIMVFVSPDEGERRFLVDSLQMDEHTLSSALDPDELSRLEFEPEHIAIIAKRPRNYVGHEEFLFRVTSLGLFLYKERLIVLMAENDPLFDGKLFANVASLTDVMLRLVYRSIFHFLEHLKVINMVCDELEHKINDSMQNRYLINLFSLEKSLVYYLNAIHTNGVLITKLKNNMTKIGLSGEQLEFLDDIAIENDQCYRLAEIYTNVLSGLMDARVSIVSNNLNVLMKRLNIVTIFIMAPTFVVSAFSMNVKLPFMDNTKSYAFWVILGMAFLSVACVTLVWKLLWEERPVKDSRRNRAKWNE